MWTPCVLIDLGTERLRKHEMKTVDARITYDNIADRDDRFFKVILNLLFSFSGIS